MLQKKNGLVQPTQIEGLMNDDKGFLWLLTPSKAQRFDGKNILSFSFDDRCIGIQQDEEGAIWVLTRQNIYRYKNDFEGFEKIPEYSSTINKYLSLLAGPHKKLYLHTTAGIFRWNPANNKMEPMGIPPFKSSGSFALLQCYGDWLFYRLSDATVARYNTVTAEQDSVHVQEPNFFVPLDADKVWVRQGIGSTVLVSFKTKVILPVNKEQFAEAFTDNRFFITAVFAGQKGEFFTIIDDKGYFSYNPATNRFKRINFFNNGKLLTGKPLLTRNNFFKEKDGTAWFINEEGIFFLNPYTANVRLLRCTNAGKNNQWNNDVRNFAEDNKDNIWFSTANGFCKWDKTNGKVSVWHPDFTAANYLNYSSVKAMGFSNNKVIIGQSEKGFWLFDPEKQTFSRPRFDTDSLKKKFENGFNANMLKLRNGNFLVLSGSVWLLDKETFYAKPVTVPEAALISRKAYEDAQGRIWLLGARGIAAMDKNFSVLYSLDDKERGKWYNAIVQINENTFWVAARGLYEIKLQPQKQLSIRSIFPEYTNQHFSNLFKDSLERIWMSSDDGMYRYIPEQHIAEKFDLSDNIQNYYAGVSNNFRGSDGTVYFGSLNGINYFVPEKIPLQNDSLQVKLLNVTVNKDDSSFLMELSLQNLNSIQNSFVFDFIAPYLYNAEKVQYRCRLQGTDKGWVYLGNNTSVRFTSLQPGEYSFYASASLNGKDWFQVKTPFSFIIHPPFWKTWWFLAMLLIVITLLAVLLIKRRIRFIKGREAEKTELQKLKAAGYQAQLEAEQIINHFATSISGQNTVDDMLWDVAKNLIGKMGFEDCMIYLWNPGKTMLLQKAGYGTKGSMQAAGDITKYHIPKGKGITGATAESKQSILVNDTSKDSRYFTADDKIRLSELCVPIIHNNETLGVINTEHSEKDFFTNRHLQILTTIASTLADKIDMLEAQQLTREKEIELLKLNKDLATSQLTALRTQMNPHFIFNALNSVQQFILQGDVVEANKYLSKFSKLQREILHYSNHNFIPLEKEIEILQSYLQLEQLRFGESFSYAINMTDEIDPTEIRIPPMMLQPFVENAIWHGLMPKQGSKNLKIYFDLDSDDILLTTIQDNGIGRKASAKLKQNNGGDNGKHQSKGMSMVQQRLQLLKQQYDKHFDVVISDITDDIGAVQGTRVALKIFIGNNTYDHG